MSFAIIYSLSKGFLIKYIGSCHRITLFFFSFFLDMCAVVSTVTSVGTPGLDTNSWTIRLKGNNVRCKIPTLTLSFVVPFGAFVIDYSNGLPRKRL